MQFFSDPNRLSAGSARTLNLWMGLCIISFAGCMNAWNTRLPMAQPVNPRSEAQAFEHQDPFPNPDIAPSMESRPRGFDRPRTQQRKAAEQRILRGIQSGPEYAPGGDAQGGLRRPQAVR